MRVYSTGAEMRSEYARIHAKFYPPVAPKIKTAVPTVERIVEPIEQPIETIEAPLSWTDALDAIGKEQETASHIPIHTITRIQRIVARYFGKDIADLLMDNRKLPLVRYRQIAMYFAKQHTSKSMPEIGRRFGGRDHTTVLHSCRRIEQLLKTDEHLQRQVAELQELIGNAKP